MLSELPQVKLGFRNVLPVFTQLVLCELDGHWTAILRTEIPNLNWF